MDTEITLEEAQRRSRAVITACNKADLLQEAIRPIRERANACGVVSGNDAQDFVYQAAAQAADANEEAIYKQLAALLRIRDRAYSAAEIQLCAKLIQQHADACNLSKLAWETLLKWRIQQHRYYGNR